MTETCLRAGARYSLSLRKADGRCLRLDARNLMPLEGRNYMLDAALRAQTPAPALYLGLYEGDWHPDDSATAATLPSLAQECTAYSQAQRPQALLAAAAQGEVSNEASRAAFTFTEARTVRGLFMATAAIKGGSGGVLLSVARLPSPKVVEPGDVLYVTARFALLSI